MTNKEAIEILKENNKLTKEALDYEITMTDKMENEIRQYTEALDLAIKALEKQEPMKPKKYIGEYLHESYPICCNCEDELMPNGETYCSSCGQAIDWNE